MLVACEKMILLPYNLNWADKAFGVAQIEKAPLHLASVMGKTIDLGNIGNLKKDKETKKTALLKDVFTNRKNFKRLLISVLCLEVICFFITDAIFYIALIVKIVHL